MTNGIQTVPPISMSDAERMTTHETGFRDYLPHDGGPCPYAQDELVDVQFADGRVELRAKASYWQNRGGLTDGMWDRAYPNHSHHIVRHRPASNRFHRVGLLK
jgi:hypothetical protein